jgi:hypothetical protein
VVCIRGDLKRVIIEAEIVKWTPTIQSLRYAIGVGFGSS